jgi:hypothetical protein
MPEITQHQATVYCENGRPFKVVYSTVETGETIEITIGTDNELNILTRVPEHVTLEVHGSNTVPSDKFNKSKP